MKIFISILAFISGFMVGAFLFYDLVPIIYNIICSYFSITEEDFVAAHLIKGFLNFLLLIAAFPTLLLCLIVTNSSSEDDFIIPIFMITWAVVGYLILDLLPQLRVTINLFFIVMSYIVLWFVFDADKKKS